MCAVDMWGPDMTDFGNSVARGPIAGPVTFSFDIHMVAKGARRNTNGTNSAWHFGHRLADMTMTWKAAGQGWTFESDDAPINTLYAAIGEVQTGKFA